MRRNRLRCHPPAIDPADSERSLSTPGEERDARIRAVQFSVKPNSMHVFVVSEDKHGCYPKGGGFVSHPIDQHVPDPLTLVALIDCHVVN
jgi:hypothetical protein